MNEMLQLNAAIMLLTPWIAAVVISLSAGRIGARGAEAVSMVLGALSWLMALLLWYQVMSLNTSSGALVLYRWQMFSAELVDVSIWVDPLSVSMALMVTTIAWVVQLYSVPYMQNDPGYARYFALMSLSTGSMLVCVMAQTLFQMFFAWEALAVAYYGLIGFWYERPACSEAAFKAVMIARLGDVALLVAMMLWLVWGGDGTLSCAGGALLPALSQGAREGLAALMLMAVMSKSVLMPLHVWAPSAVVAPMPVSALMYAATVAICGIFFVLRCAPVFSAAEYVRSAMVLLGSGGALWMALLACDQKDLKQLMAYSSASQLSVMLCVCGLGAYSVAWIHLMVYSFSNALMFLVVGRILYVCGQEAAWDRLGGLRMVLPWTCFFAVWASACWIGVPVFSGFVWKQAMFEHIAARGSGGAYVLAAVMLCISMLYTLCHVRWVYRVFWGPTQRVFPNESWNVMHFSLVLLAVPSMFLGMGMMASIDSDYWGLGGVPGVSEALSVLWRRLNFLSVILGGAWAYGFDRFRRHVGFIRFWRLVRHYAYALSEWDRFCASAVFQIGHGLAWMDEHFLSRRSVLWVTQGVVVVSERLKHWVHEVSEQRWCVLMGGAMVMIVFVYRYGA